MNREYHRWHSPALGRDMELLVFGHGGARVLAFPTCAGRFYDWENFGMVAALADRLQRGYCQLFCADTVDNEAWFAEGLPPEARARRHAQYDRYVRDEVLPFSRQRNPSSFLTVAGTSFGAYHAINFAFRYPE